MEASALAAKANFSGNSSHTTKCNDKYKGALWLIDSGASWHLAGSRRQFQNYVSYLNK
jgi:hypothetical protein